MLDRKSSARTSLNTEISAISQVLINKSRLQASILFDNLVWMSEFSTNVLSAMVIS